jgi:hypothetical protein
MDDSDLADFFTAVYGDTSGYLHIAVGEGPRWVDDKYGHEHWTQTHFAYPAERDQAVREIARAALAGGDVYICPNLMCADKRAQGAAAARMVVHADVDDGRYDPEKVAAAGGFAVASGTPGNAHVYVPLSESVPASVHRELCRGLSRYLGAVDAKISDNDLLRPPGTLNYKTAALGGDPSPVQWLGTPNGRVASVTLAELVGAGQPALSGAAGAAESVNLDRYPTVKTALDAISAPADRSKDTMRVVAACYAAGLTLPQTRRVVSTRPDLAARLDGRNDDDVKTCWLKAIDDRQTAAPSTASSPVVDGAQLLDALVAWFRRFIAVTDDLDLALLALWTVHTHLAKELYTTPRLWLDSVLPASGKTTVLDHLERLALHPIQMATVSSSALLPRLLEKGPRTILLDEIQRSLDPDKPGVGDVLAIINTGYRVGAKRPVLVATKGGWDAVDMPTFAPLAMAGSSPQLPDDTCSRSIRLLLMPDLTGSVEDSDWEFIAADAATLRAQIADFADMVRTSIRETQVDLPAGCVSRQKEKWRPLERVAVAASGRWPGIADLLIKRGLAEDAAENEAGLRYLPPGMIALTDLHKVWPKDEDFMSTRGLVDLLKLHNSDYWGADSPYGKPLTDTRLGRLIAQASKITSQRVGGRGPRGYSRALLEPVWRRLGITRHPLLLTGALGEPDEPDGDCAGLTGSTGCTGQNETPLEGL